MHIGILQCGHVAEPMRTQTGDFSAMFKRLLGEDDNRFTIWNVVDMDFPTGPEAAEGWLITGSKHGVYEPHAFIPPLEDLIRAIHAARVPLVGVCFGHQIIAQALGGHVEKFAGGWMVGRQDYDWCGTPVAMNAWHQDQVIRAPEGAQVLASGPGCAHAALAYGDHVMTVQAHPEFSHDTVGALIEHRSATVPPDLLDRARAQMGLPTDATRVAAHMRAVLAGARP